MESSLKSLIGRLRSKPEWQSEDPAVRAAAILRLHAEERDLLLTFVDDPDARVRKAAVKKVHDPAVLARLATTDAELSVREEAEEALLALALHAKDLAGGQAALLGLSLPRHLLAVVRSAAFPATRRVALEMITDAKHLAAAAREAPDADLRLDAVARLTDPAQLLALAQHCEHKPVALAAVEKLVEPAALETVAAKAKVGTASRRARARLDASLPAAEAAPPPPPPDDAVEREAYERHLTLLRAEQEARSKAVAEREAVCERLEAAAAEAAQDAMDEARGAWEGLAPLAGSEAEALHRRFEAALDACERRKAEWQARGAALSALEALAGEAETLVGGPDAAAARAAFPALKQRWQEAARGLAEIESLQERFDVVAARVSETEAQARQEREAQEKQRLSRVRGLAERLHALAAAKAPALREVERALREAREALEHPLPGPSKKDREALHARLEAGRKALYPRLAELRVDTEWKRWANESVQEELVARVEALRTETNLEKAAQDLRDLEARWKAAADVDKEKGEDLWKQWKTARDEVKARIDAFFAERALLHAENLKKCHALCAQAEGFQESTDWLKTADALKALQAEWKTVGPTAHGPGQAAWNRFRAACDRFFTRREEDLKQKKGEWSANEAKKQDLIARATALAESTDWEAAQVGIKALQAEWKAAGPVKKSRSEPLWQAFRDACDRFFERYKRRDQIAFEKSQAEREAMLASLETLGSGAGREDPAPEGLGAKVTEVQAAWRQAGPLARDQATLGERFKKAVHALVEAYPAAFAGTELDPAAARKKLEKLCAKLEAMAPAAAPAKSLAEQLKDALATNTMGGKGEAEARRRAQADEVRAAREAFSRLPPVTGAEGSALRLRFETAARLAVGEKA